MLEYMVNIEMVCDGKKAEKAEKEEKENSQTKDDDK